MIHAGIPALVVTEGHVALVTDPGREGVLCGDLDYDMTKGTVRRLLVSDPLV